jgi:hypothetical protein
VSYPGYTYDDNGNQSDPVNLIYKKTSSDEVSNFLKQNGWNDAIGNNQFLHLPTGQKVNDIQLEEGSFWTTRFHMRLWNMKDYSIGSAHYETYQLIRHEVHHFEGAEKKVADAFQISADWQVDYNAEDLNLINFEKYNNGKVTFISKTGAP